MGTFIMQNCQSRSLALILSLLFFSTTVFSALPRQTPLEESAYKHLPKSQEINAFLHKLVENSSNMQLITLGKTAGGRDITALMVSKDPLFLKTGQSSKNKLTVLMLGSQHGTEPSGCEGLQKLALNFAGHELDPFLKDMNLMLVVNANPDGRDLTSRFNAINGNINIDFIKQRYPETRIFTEVLNRYHPDAILDLHESSTKKKILTLEQGYTRDVDAQYEIGNNPNIDPQLSLYAKNTMLPELISITRKKGLYSSHYKGEIQTLHQPVAHGGLHASNLRNYSALHGSLSFLVENRLDTPDQNYPTPGNIQIRKEKQYTSALSFLTLLSQHKPDILTRARKAQQSWKQDLSRQPEIKFLAKYSLDLQKPCVPVHLKDAKTHAPVVREFANYDYVDIKYSLALPDGYAVTQAQTEIAALLHKHHIKFRIINKTEKVLAMPLKITAIQEIWPENPKLSSSVEIEANTLLNRGELHQGDLLINLQQPRGRLAALLLDPRSMDSIFQDLHFRPLLVKNTPLMIYPVKFHALV